MVMYKIFEGLERGEARVEDKNCNTVFLIYLEKGVTKGNIYIMYWRLYIYWSERYVHP